VATAIAAGTIATAATAVTATTASIAATTTSVTTASASIAATASVAAATATATAASIATATAVFGVGAAGMGDRVRNQDGGCRQHPTNGKSKDRLFELHKFLHLLVLVIEPQQSRCKSEAIACSAIETSAHLA